MNKKIMNKIDDIIKYIKNSDDYQKYLVIEKKMNTNNDINLLVESIRKLQKQAVYEEHIGNISNVKKLDQEINKKLNELNNIPLYAEYTNSIEVLNSTLLDIKNIIESYINEKTN